jgi:hypothetical protein
MFRKSLKFLLAQPPPFRISPVPLGPILRRDVGIAAFEFNQLLQVGRADYFFLPHNGGEFGFGQNHVLARLDRTAIAEDAAVRVRLSRCRRKEISSGPCC